MKKIVFLLICLFSFSFGVKANVSPYLKDVVLPTNLRFYSLSANGDTMLNAQRHNWNFVNSTFDFNGWAFDRVTLGNYGAALNIQTNTSFIKDNYYALTMYFATSVNTYNIYGYQFSNYWFKLGTGPGWTMNMNNSADVLSHTSNLCLDMGSTNNEHIRPYQYLCTYSVVFKANVPGSYLWTAFSTNREITVGDATFFYIGYVLDFQGNKPTSAEEVAAALESNFNEISNDISNSTNSINENIDNLEESINNAIYSDSEDVSSDKCGIVCKLKALVSGIANLPSLIWNAIKGGFEAIISGLTAVGDLIKNALETLGNFLIEGIKGLFVPTNDQLYEIIQDASDLSENFGFVGESVSFFIKIFTALLGMANANGCIELPEFTIGPARSEVSVGPVKNLFDGVTFWNAQNVCLADNVILSANIDTIRTITSIALVCLFINFAARQFFSILSKKDNNDASIYAAEVGD